MTGLSVPCPDVVEMAAEFVARHLCPFVDEADDGSVTVSWVTSHGETFELHALSELVRAREQERVSHEQWTADLAGDLAAAAQVSELGVTSVWSTAGATVTVRAPAAVEGGVA
jgi:hypothetical protein